MFEVSLGLLALVISVFILCASFLLGDSKKKTVPIISRPKNKVDPKTCKHVWRYSRIYPNCFHEYKCKYCGTLWDINGYIPEIANSRQ